MSGHRVVRTGSVDQASAASYWPEPARVRPRRELAGERQPGAHDLGVLEIGYRQVAHRLGGVEERGQVVVQPGQVALHRGDGDLPCRGPLALPMSAAARTRSGWSSDQRLGDPAPHGVTGDAYRFVPAEVVQQRQRIVGHRSTL